MYKFYFVLLLCICYGEDYLENFEDIIWRRNDKDKNDEVYTKPVLNLYKTYFPSLSNYEMNGAYISEKKYRWIARVIHSRTRDVPHVCTAVCIHEEIFISAYRCISPLKVTYTRVKYNTEMINAKAFVLPTNITKQSFDDIAFIIVRNKQYWWPFYTIALFNVNRTDDTFQWYANLDFSDTHMAIGYATWKSHRSLKTVDTIYRLTELVVYIDMKICHEIFTFNYLMGGFKVPCYHSCSLEEYRRDDKKCTNYHGVEGGAVINTKTERLLGLATWGAYYPKYELPVGMSIVNSENFYKDYACAKLIQNDNKTQVSENFYQRLCDKGTTKSRRFGIVM